MRLGDRKLQRQCHGPTILLKPSLVNRILLTGDFLRPLEADPCQSESVRRIRWFEDLLGPPLSLVTDLPIDRLACDGDLQLRSLYEDADLSPSVDAWAQLYAGPITGPLASRIVDLCRDAIVISIELPASIATLLQNANIPVIDASVDPHRFLYDIPLAWRSTLASVRDTFESFRVSSFEICRRAGQIKAKTRWLPPIDVPRGATLVLDQVSTDAAMIDPARQRRVCWNDFLGELDRLKCFGPIVWRPHPNNVEASAYRPSARRCFAVERQHLSTPESRPSRARRGDFLGRCRRGPCVRERRDSIPGSLRQRSHSTAGAILFRSSAIGCRPISGVPC